MPANKLKMGLPEVRVITDRWGNPKKVLIDGVNVPHVQSVSSIQEAGSLPRVTIDLTGILTTVIVEDVKQTEES